MAPKNKVVKDSNMAPTVVRTEVVLLEDISVEEDSGWRPICETMVKTLMAMFRAGDYGSGILTIPSILLIDGTFAPSTRDGRFRLNNGKSTITALKRLELEFRAIPTASPTEACPQDAVNASTEACPQAVVNASTEACPHNTDTNWPANLVNMFENGVRVDWVRLASNDADLHFAWNAMIHDADVNKYSVTTISQNIAVAKRYNARVPGGDWDATRKLLMSVLGAGKRANIWRWVTGARTLSDPVLKVLDQRPALPNSVVFENKYFCGQGEERKFKLTDTFAERALILMYDKLDSGSSVSSKDFQSDFCGPMKTVELWHRAIMGQFGTHAQALPAVKRVFDMLTNESGRMRVLQCMKQKVPLHGRRWSGWNSGVHHDLERNGVSQRTAGRDGKRQGGKPQCGWLSGGMSPGRPGYGQHGHRSGH